MLSCVLLAILSFFSVVNWRKFFRWLATITFARVIKYTHVQRNTRDNFGVTKHRVSSGVEERKSMREDIKKERGENARGSKRLVKLLRLILLVLAGEKTKLFSPFTKIYRSKSLIVCIFSLYVSKKASGLWRIKEERLKPPWRVRRIVDTLSLSLSCISDNLSLVLPVFMSHNCAV